MLQSHLIPNFSETLPSSPGAILAVGSEKQPYHEALYDVLAPRWPLITLVAIIAASFLFRRPIENEDFWKSHPFVGYTKKEWFAGLRGQVRAIFDVKATVYEGYHKFSKLGKPFAMPMFLSKPLLVLPPELASNLKNRKDFELSSRLVMIDQTKSRWTMPRGILEHDYHLEMVRKQLTRKLPAITADIADEVRLSFEDHWPNTNEWTAINLYPLAMKIVARSANRVFTGSDLCRNEDFLDHSATYARNVFTGALYIRMFPRWMHPVIAPVIAFPNRRHFNICMKHCTPVVQKRVADTLKQRNGQMGPDYEQPNDFLQWLIDEGLDTGDHYRLQPTELVSRLMNLNMAAIHTSSMLFTNILMDLFSSPNTDDFIAGLREEIDRVKPKDGELWDKNMVSQLIRLDSALKESLRFTALGDLSAMRLITAPGGVHFTKDLHVPAGEHVALPARAVHRDPDYYPNPDAYDPFRFSRLVEQQQEADAQDKKDGADATLAPHQSIKAAQSMVTLDDNFLSFGAGKHACTGRFFAANELKLVMAYFLDHYDVKKMEKRPENMDILATSTPLDSWKVETRLRQDYSS